MVVTFHLLTKKISVLVHTRISWAQTLILIRHGRRCWSIPLDRENGGSVLHQLLHRGLPLMDSTPTCWNNHFKSIGIDVAYAMGWETLNQMMIEKYCLWQEDHTLEQELWNLTMKGSEVNAYTSRFNDFANLCLVVVNPEYKKSTRYIWGLSSLVQGQVTASRPTTFDSAK